MEDRIKLICLDLDGTLFDPKGQISQRDRDAIRYAVSKGTQVMISTGRPYVGLPDLELLASLGIRYALTVNGAAIYTIPDKKILSENCMEPVRLAALLKRCQELPLYYDIFVNGEGIGFGKKKEMIRKLALLESQKEYILRTRTFYEDPAEYILEKKLKVQKVTLDFCEGPDNKLEGFEEAKKILKDFPEYTVVSGGCNNLELTRLGVSKGTALTAFLDVLNLTKNEVMVCGDSENDLDIMKSVKYSVAMANAQDCVRKDAYFITKSNGESGVAHAIYTFLP